MYEIIVDNEKCIGCGECVDICPMEVYELQDEKSVPVNAEECEGCESCIEVCEQEAITVREYGETADRDWEMDSDQYFGYHPLPLKERLKC